MKFNLIKYNTPNKQVNLVFTCLSNWFARFTMFKQHRNL